MHPARLHNTGQRDTIYEQIVAIKNRGSDLADFLRKLFNMRNIRGFPLVAGYGMAATWNNTPCDFSFIPVFYKNIFFLLKQMQKLNVNR